MNVEVRNNVTRLSEVKSYDDFESCYNYNNLSSDPLERINFLRDKLQVRAIRYAQDIPPASQLRDLEEYALLHPWYCVD